MFCNFPLYLALHQNQLFITGPKENSIANTTTTNNNNNSYNNKKTLVIRSEFSDLKLYLLPGSITKSVWFN